MDAVIARGSWIEKVMFLHFDPGGAPIPKPYKTFHPPAWAWHVLDSRHQGCKMEVAGWSWHHVAFNDLLLTHALPCPSGRKEGHSVKWHQIEFGALWTVMGNKMDCQIVIRDKIKQHLRSAFRISPEFNILHSHTYIVQNWEVGGIYACIHDSYAIRKEGRELERQVGNLLIILISKSRK